MSKDNIVSYENPAAMVVQDQLTSFIREAAQKMLKIAIETEVSEFIKQHENLTLATGCPRVVRNGFLPERAIQTGIGGIKIKLPRIRDREGREEKITFQSYLIPKYMRRTATLDVMLPLLYLKGISTGDFPDVLTPMLGTGAKAVSPSVVGRLKASWVEEHESWRKLDLSQKRYVYWWVDGIYLKARMEDEKTCMLVIVGADEQGRKELVGFIDGFRESKESWLELLRDLQGRCLKTGPMLAVGDGGLGFWGALREIYPKSKQQRCWVHKTANVLDKLPKSLQAKAKTMLHDIYLSDTKKEAVVALNNFIKTHSLKHPKATQCLAKDEDTLLAFYDFPAEHWAHIRTTNPIESTFATVRHRTKKSKNCFSRDTIIASVFKLCKEAEKRWKRLYGHGRLADVIDLVKFTDGVREVKLEENNNKENNLCTA
jgi:putative transposase